MAQPDNFGFTEEAALLKESARKFFADNLPVDRLHALVAGDHAPETMNQCHWDRDLWGRMVDLGWSMLAVPESAGGVGMPNVAVAGLVEELGRADTLKNVQRSKSRVRIRLRRMRRRR